MPDLSHPAQTLRILHAALFAGQMILGLAFGLLTLVLGPLLGDTHVLGLILAGASTAALALAIVVLRPRIPTRPGDVDPDDYWAVDETRSAAQLVWFVVEGVTLLSFIGYFLTGMYASVIVGLVGMLVFFWLRPSQLEGN